VVTKSRWDEYRLLLGVGNSYLPLVI
jgi:hypothetical protein